MGQSCWHSQIERQHERSIISTSIIEQAKVRLNDTLHHGLVQDCGISSADALDIPQSCIKRNDKMIWLAISKYTTQYVYTIFILSNDWPLVFKWQAFQEHISLTATIESTFYCNPIPDHLITVNFAHVMTAQMFPDISLHHMNAKYIFYIARWAIWLLWWPPTLSFCIMFYLYIAVLFAGNKSYTTTNTIENGNAILIYPVC